MNTETLPVDIASHAVNVGRFAERSENFNVQARAFLERIKENRARWNKSLENLKRVHACASANTCEICRMLERI